MRITTLILVVFCLQICSAQYKFSGYINPEQNSSSVYLSVIDDYRKLSGVYNEQIISKTEADSLGFFIFSGNLLEPENRIYKIHTDNCNGQYEGSHFNGICTDSYQITFIAKNTDTLHLPYTFDKQIFCDIESNNPKSIALIRIDSLKEEMKFAYTEYRSEANRKLNNKKWFQILQDFSKNLDEPLAELYTYAYISDRTNDLNDYYIEDLKTNRFYEALGQHLNTAYPESSYTKQYFKELRADQYMLTSNSYVTADNKTIILFSLLVISIGLNIVLLYRTFRQKRDRKTELKGNLSKQEQVVLEHLLQDKTNKEIAESLFLSVSTVKTHNNNIYKKLKVQSREDLKYLFNS